MTPAEFIDFKTIALPTIAAGGTYDSEGKLQLQSDPRFGGRFPEVYQREELRPIPETDFSTEAPKARAEDVRYRNRILGLMR